MKDQVFYIIELDGVLQEPHFATYQDAYNKIEELFANPELTYKEGRIIQCKLKDMMVTIKNKKK